MSNQIAMQELAAHHAEQAWNEDQLRATVERPALRLWRYHEPAVVLGCSQRSLLSAEQCLLRSGVDLAQRQAGGGAVLVGPWMLSASIALPCAHPLVTASTVQSYRWLGELYVSVLGDAGIATEAITPELARANQQQASANSLSWACYGGLSPWEVVVDCRKIVGLAQVRRRNGILLVAGLLLDRPDWPLLCRAMDQSADSAGLLAAHTTSCAEQLQRPPPATEIADSLQRALLQAIDV